MEASNGQDTPQRDSVSTPLEDLQCWHSSLSVATGLQVDSNPESAEACVRQSSQGPPRIIKGLSTQLSQVNKAVGDLKKSFDQLRSDVDAITTRFSSTAGSTANTPSQSLTLDCAGWVREGGSRELSTAAVASAASACESRTDYDTAAYCGRLSALEARCKDLRDSLDGLQETISFPEATERLVQTALTDRLEQFHAELEEKLKHLTPSNFGIEELNRDLASPLAAAKQKSSIDLGADNVSTTVTSVYVMLRTEVMQEVAQLRSFIERELRSLRSQFEMESAKVEQTAITLCGMEATNNRLSQRMGEMSLDFTKLQETGITHEREVSKLRSCLEVVVRERDEHFSKEQGCQAEESAAFMSTLLGQVSTTCANEKGLSERVQSLENACKQVMALPSVVLEAAQELSQKQSTIVQEQVSILTDLVACACTAREPVATGVGQSGNQQQQPLRHPAAAKQQQQERRQTPRSEMMRGGLGSNSVPPVNVTAVSSSHSFVNQPRSAQVGADLTRDMMWRSSPTSSFGVSPATPVPSSWPSVEGQVLQGSRLEEAVARLDELSDEMRAEQARQVMLAEKWVASTEAAFSADLNSVRDTVACTLLSRLSSLESIMTRHTGSNTSIVARRQALLEVAAIDMTA